MLLATCSDSHFYIYDIRLKHVLWSYTMPSCTKLRFSTNGYVMLALSHPAYFIDLRHPIFTVQSTTDPRLLNARFDFSGKYVTTVSADAMCVSSTKDNACVLSMEGAFVDSFFGVNASYIILGDSTKQYVLST